MTVHGDRSVISIRARLKIWFGQSSLVCTRTRLGSMKTLYSMLNFSTGMLMEMTGFSEIFRWP